MEDARIVQMQEKIEYLQEVNGMLQEDKRQLREALEFNQNFIKMAAKLKTIEYIVRSEERFIDKKSLSSVLEIPLSKKDVDCDDDCDRDDWESYISGQQGSSGSKQEV